MKNVRIFYTKTGRMKFVSHLDMNRLMIRILRKSEIPVWYTEGFNKRVYVNYAVPLSLGYEGVYEIMDIRLTDDAFTYEEVVNRLNSVSTEGIEFLRADEPVRPTKDIMFSQYQIEFENRSDLFFDTFRKFLSLPSVICQKTDKKGRIKEFDIIPKIKEYAISENTLTVTLTAGNEGNLNPAVLIKAFFENTGTKPLFYTVKRTMLFDKDMNYFL